MKKGPWSLDEKKFIEDNLDLHYEDIAKKLDRDPKRVRKYIEINLGKSTSISKGMQKEIDLDIKKSMVWKELKGQFTPDELRKFVYHWERIIVQFKEDILPTEEMQVVDYIKLDILMDRILQQQQDNLLEIQRLEKQIAEEKNKPEDIQDFSRISGLSDQINMRRTAQSSVTKEYKDLLQEKSKILDKMKGTRDARIKYLESSKDSLIGWVKQVVTDNKLRDRLGTYMEKLRLSMENEKERLSQPHKYVDNMVDLPLLTTETFKKYEEQ